MEVFESVTQYDNSFNNLIKSSKKGLACPYFALITVNEFINKHKINDQHSHFQNISKSITMSDNLKTINELSFDELIKLTDLNLKDIQCTNINLISSGDFNLKNLFVDNTDFSVIFLKNAKYFVVNYNKKQNIFSLRDCHESFQYDFLNVEKLIEHLNDVYQFNQRINVSGISYDDYGSIEFIKIKDKFKLVFYVDGINDNNHMYDNNHINDDFNDDIQEAIRLSLLELSEEI